MNPPKRFLNVGGNNKGIPLALEYRGWEHVMLDIDPRSNADLICDARQLATLAPSAFDSVYCSQNLEHYHRHEGLQVLKGFRHILKDDGFAFIIVPDMQAVMKIVVERELDIDDVLYRTRSGMSILVRDVIYGYGREIEASGNDFFAHKTGFTTRSLQQFLEEAGFAQVIARRKGWLDVMAFAFKQPPSAAMQDYAQSTLDRLQHG
jgi:hypothetical protein